jgi:hypothetical protein
MSLDPLDPDDRLDYKWNWDKWLPPGVTIVASEFFLPDEGITKDDDSFGDRSTTIWLLEGTPGNHDITNRITDSDGRIRNKTLTIRVKEL